MNDTAYTGRRDPINCPSNQVVAPKPQPKRDRKRFGDFFPSRFTKSQWRKNRRGGL